LHETIVRPLHQCGDRTMIFGCGPDAGRRVIGSIFSISASPGKLSPCRRRSEHLLNLAQRGVHGAKSQREAIMSLRRLGFLLLTALSAAVAMPVLGQTVLPTAGNRDGGSIPDFSGMWVHPYFPGIEPPASGPGPVFNRSRSARGAGNNAQFVGDYTNPILTPQAAAVVKKHGEISLSGMTYPTPSNRCWPSGVPYIFFQPGMQMLQLPDRIVFLYLRDHEFRHVRLKAPHAPDVTPSWYGDSVGHYEGDVLVIDTVGVKADRPFAMVDMYGTPFGPALHVVERYRMVDYDEAEAAVARNLTQNNRVPDTASDPTFRGKRLQLVFTVEDQGAFTMPWSGTITYEAPGMAWPEHVCSENRFEFFAGKNEAFVPTANKPDF
jgi:hypothetical protein